MSTSPDSPPLMARPWVYFTIALAWSWLCWIPLGLLHLGFTDPVGLGVGLLGLFGPAVAGITCTYATQGPEGRRDYWTRIVDWRRIGPRWYAVILLFVPALFVVAVVLDNLLGGTGGQWDESARRIVAQPWSLVPIALGILFLGPMEEFGWRGYVLDRLQKDGGPLRASLILGPLWSLWHLPLFFIPGTYQQGLGVGTLYFWLFMIGILGLNFVFTWIYNHTNRSTLAIMLFHFMVNFTGQMFAFTPSAKTISILLWFAAAVVVAWTWRGGVLAPTEAT